MEGLIDFSKILKNKIPVLFSTINFGIVNSLYQDCAVGEETKKTSFYIYFPTLCVLCIAWEYAHSYTEYSKLYPNKYCSDYVCFASISTFINLTVFFSSAYYPSDGKPFSCYTSYNRNIALATFYVTCGIAFIISLVEYLMRSKRSGSRLIDYNTDSSSEIF